MVTRNAANMPTGASGTIAQGQGVGTAVAFSTATYPATAGTSGKVLVSDGTNIVSSTPTFPNASATSGKLIQSDGTNWVASTPTYPTTAGTSGKIHISDGTNIVSSTPTYPNASVTAGKVIISDGTNYIASTPTFPNASATSGKFIRSDGTNWIASTPTLPTTGGTSGTILRSDGTNFLNTTTTYPNTTAQGDIIYASAANTISALTKDTNATRYLSNTGTTNNPLWAQVALTTGVSGVLPIANGGTNASSMSTNTGIAKFDGTSIVTSSAAKIDSSNRMTNTSQPCFLVQFGAGAANVTGDGTVYPLLFDTSVFDQNSNITLNSGGKTIFTAPVTGRYLFMMNMLFTIAGGAILSTVTFNTTSATYFGGYINPTAVASVGSGYFTITAFNIVAMSATDTAYYDVAMTGGTKTCTVYTGAQFNNFSGHLIC